MVKPEKEVWGTGDAKYISLHSLQGLGSRSLGFELCRFGSIITATRTYCLARLHKHNLNSHESSRTLLDEKKSYGSLCATFKGFDFGAELGTLPECPGSGIAPGLRYATPNMQTANTPSRAVWCIWCAVDHNGAMTGHMRGRSGNYVMQLKPKPCNQDPETVEPSSI